MIQIGVNWTSPRDANVIHQLVRSGNIDFVEIMIDNFIMTDTSSFLKVVDGIPCSFHIMNSRFIHRPEGELVDMLRIIREHAGALHPTYISDHLGCFYYKGMELPRMAEIEYDSMFDVVRGRVELFQDCIGHPVLFENYPSVIRGLGLGQPKFLNDLCEVTGCGVLFDISNADIASQNTGLDLNAWIPVIGRSQHFHIGGYAETSFQPSFIVDTHDTNLSESSLNFTVSYVRPYASVSSVVVERDVNLDVEAWEIDIDKVRGSLSEQ